MNILASFERFDKDGIELIIDTATGESFASISGYARMSGIDPLVIEKESCVLEIDGKKVLNESSIIDLSIKYAIEKNSYRSALIIQKAMLLALNPNRINFPLDSGEAMEMCQNLYPSVCKQKINKKTKKQAKKKLKTKAQKSNEYSVQLSLKKQLGGQIEVQTPLGRIDLLTENKVIEIKEAKAWKSAIGQLLAYGQFYPDHEKVLYLFGDISSINISDVKYILSAIDISLDVTYLQDLISD